MIVINRKEQWDILKGGIKNPLLVIGWKEPGHYARLFCLWKWGIWIRLWGKQRLCCELAEELGDD